MNQEVAAGSVRVLGEPLDIRESTALDENDRLILDDVEHAIGDDEVLRRIDLPTLRIQVRDGRVLLRGNVATRPHGERIDAIVRKVRGVREVANQLVADDDLAQAVAGALGEDPLTRSDFFRVASTHGVVRLSTRLLHGDAFETAEAIASRVPGVRAVVIVDPDSHEEPAVLLPAIGTTIYCQDGELGKLERVVVSRSSRQVIELVVAAKLHPDVAQDLYGDARPVEHELVVPLPYLERVVPAGIFLAMTIGQADRLPRYEADKYATPDASWRPSIDYRAEDVRFPKEG